MIRIAAAALVLLTASPTLAQSPEFDAECDGGPTLGTMISGPHVYLRVSLPTNTWCFEPCRSQQISEVKSDVITLKNTYPRVDELGLEAWTLDRQSGELTITFMPAKKGFFSLIPPYGWRGLCRRTPFTGFGNVF